MLSEDPAPRPPDALLRELDRRGVAYQLGRVILGVTRGDEPAVRAALTAAGVSRDLVYNQGFLMLLPEGVDKGTGVPDRASVLQVVVSRCPGLRRC